MFSADEFSCPVGVLGQGLNECLGSFKDAFFGDHAPSDDDGVFLLKGVIIIGLRCKVNAVRKNFSNEVV